MSPRVTRRRFLHTAAGALSFWSGLPRALGKPDSPNERLHVGVIGVAGQGAYDLRETAGAGAAIVALCDVDENRASQARKNHPQAKFYPDYRRLLEQKGIDAVVIATPDHTHAFATMAALKAGLHVYCEKPLTHNVYEARLVAETAAKQKRVTQMGTQIHAGSNYRRVVELIQSGAIGPVSEVHAWVGRSWGGARRPKEEQPVPEGLHYDLWLGPAPYRPYNRAYLPQRWRGWWDFGGGTMADMACHYLDLPYWALGLRHPTKVSAEGPPADPEAAAAWLIVRYDFPGRGDQPPVKVTWYDGGKRPPHFAEGKVPAWRGDGVLFVGAKGMLMADYTKHRLLPESQFAGFTPPKPTIAESIGHHKEWVEACKTGGATTCNFNYSGALAETALLGVVAHRVGKPFNWDAQNLKASEPEAERFLRGEYRKPWSLETV